MDRIVRNFKIVEAIGNGTTGVVHKAIQLALDRTVALKELHGHLARDADFIKRFEREAKTAATLSHENILSVIDFGKEGDAYFIALEYVDGSDLKQLMQIPDETGNEAASAKVPPEVATAIALGIVRGLEHAHGRGIVHRDMKPANVMISREGTAKIADFSIAQASQLPSMTVTGAMMGTPAYMSPEQVAGRPLDARTDLFSAGVILFEMLAGRRPFEGDSYPTIISQLLTTIPPDLHDLDPFIPQELAAIVKRALEKDASKRFANATELAEALENAAHEANMRVSRSVIAEWAKNPKAYSLAAVARSIPPTPIRAKATPPRAPKRLWLGAPVALVVIALAGWGGKALLGGWEAATPTPLAVAETPTATPVIETPTVAPTQTATPIAKQTQKAQKTPTPRSTKIAKATPVPTPTGTLVAVVGKSKPAMLHIFATPWAHVYIDGVKVDTTPLASPIELAPGPHKLTLQYSDFRPFTENIVVKPGETLERKVSFDARVRLQSNRVADVYLNGDHVGTTTTPFEVPPGRHTLTLRSARCSDLALPIEPRPGQTIEKSVKLACN